MLKTLDGILPSSYFACLYLSFIRRRLDYFIVSKGFMPSVVDTAIRTAVQGSEYAYLISLSLFHLPLTCHLSLFLTVIVQFFYSSKTEVYVSIKRHLVPKCNYIFKY